VNVALLRSSFQAIAPRADDVARRFYARMFAVYPQVRPLFAGTDPDAQRSKLMASVAAVVALVDRPDELEPVLQQMGARHEDYGVQAHQYEYVCASMLATLAETLGEGWTAEVAQTWSDALRHVSDRMIADQRPVAA
jgi:methyl-accepting chemotaxis protein